MDSIQNTVTAHVFEEAKELYKNHHYKQSLLVLSGISPDKLSEDENKSISEFDFYSLRCQNYFFVNDTENALNDANKCLNLNLQKEENLIEIFNIFLKFNQIEKAEEVYKKLEHTKESSTKLEELKQQLNTKKSKAYQDFNYFVKCLKDKNTEINRIDLVFHTNSYRSVIATDKIKKNEIILKIPLEALITLEMAKECPLGSKITNDLQKQLNSPHHSILSTFLLEEFEKGEKSEWYFYIQLLPESYASFPIFYPESFIEKHLKGSQFYQTVQTKKKEILADYELLCKEIPEYKKFKFETFCRARMIISSRIFGVTVHDKKTDVLAPYADMLNHKRPRETHWTFEESENAFVLSAIQDIKKGQEIFDSYGKKCNSRFLLNYGFIVEDNEDNEFKFTIDLTQNHPQFDEKKKLLGSQKNMSRKFSLRKDLDDQQFYLFISYIRFLNDSENLNKYKNLSIKDDKILPISRANEIASLNEIKNICKNFLSNYENSLEDDYNLIKKGIEDFNERNCCMMRISEKEVLEFYLKLAEFGIRLIEMPKDEVIELLKNGKDERIEKYKIYISQIKSLLLMQA